MNSSTPSPACTYSELTAPGWASDHSDASTSSTPNTINVSAPVRPVVVQIGDSAAYRPATATTQSCHRVHVFIVDASPTAREPKLTPPKLNLTDRPVKSL